MLDPQDKHPDSPEATQEFLEEVRSVELGLFNSDDETAQDRYRSYIRDVKRDLRSPAQILPELLQNADDVAECESVVIQLTGSTLRVWNDGRPMTEAEVRSLCALGESTKEMSDRDHIGHFGRGFKSVFSISANPIIRSGNFCFSLDDDRLTVPEDIKKPPTKFTGTEIVLPMGEGLRSDERTELEDRVQSVERLLPYLRNVSTIVVNRYGEKTVYRRREIGRKNEITITRNEEIHDRRKLFETTAVPTGDAREELITQRDLSQQEISEVSDDDVRTKITIALPVDEDGYPNPTPSESRLFNYLPTAEQPHLPFDIQADFLLKSDRESLSRPQGPYNQWLLRQTATAFQQLFEFYKERYKGQETGSDAHLRALPSSTELNAKFAVVQEAIFEQLPRIECIPTEDGWARPVDVISPSERLRFTLSASTLSSLLGQDISYPDGEAQSSLFEELAERELLDRYTVADVAKECADTGSSLTALNRAELYSLVVALDEYDRENFRNTHRYKRRDERRSFRSAIEKLPLLQLGNDEREAYAALETDPVIPSEASRGTLRTFKKALPLLDISPPEDKTASKETSIPEDDLENTRESYSNLFDFDTLTPTTAIKRVIAPAFAKIDETADEKLDAYLEFMFTNRERWDPATTYVSLKVRTTSGEYVNPSESPIFFPDAYGGGFSREAILQCCDVANLSTDYLGLTEHDGSRWREFLTKFGVREKLHVKQEGESERQLLPSEDRLRDYLNNPGDDIDIPHSMGKSGKKNRWMKGNKYAVCNSNPSTIFESVLNAFDADDADLKAGKELAKMLDSNWGYYEDRMFVDLYYVKKPSQAYEAKRKETDIPSLFGEQLQNVPWFPTSDGELAPPKTLVTDETVSTGGVSVQRCGYDPRPACREALNISSRLDHRAAVQVLERACKVWSGKSPASIRSEIRQLFDTIQRDLEEVSEKEENNIYDRLSDARCIYVENATTQFRKPAQVAWKGKNLGDFLVTVGNTYRSNMELLSEIGVRDEIGADAHLEYLVHCESVNDVTRISTVWPRTMSLLVKVVENHDDVTADLDVISRLHTEPCLPTEAGTFVTLSKLQYYCYDDEIRNHLSDESLLTATVSAIGIGSIDESWPDLWDSLGLEDLSEHLDLVIISESEMDLQENSQTESDRRQGALADVEDASQLLDVAYSVVDAKDDSLTKCERELGMLATEYSIYRPETITVQYTMGTSIEEPVSEAFDVDCFIDDEMQTVYLSPGIDSSYALAERLAARLSQSSLNGLVDILSGALGKSPDHIQAFLAERDVPYQELEPDSLETIETTTEQQRKPKTDDNGGTDADDEGETDADDEEHESEPPEPTTIEATSPSPSVDESTGGTEKANNGQTDHGAVDGNTTSATVDQPNRPSSVPDGRQKEATTASATEDSDVIPASLSDDSSQSTTQDRVPLSSPPTEPKTASSSGSASNGGAGKSNGQGSPQRKSMESTVGTDETVPPKTAKEASGETLTSHQQDTLEVKTSSGGWNGSGGGGGTSNGGQAAILVGKWGEDFVFDDLAEFLAESLPGEQVSTDWDWSGVHPETPNTHPHAEKGADGHVCPITGSTIPGVRFDSPLLDHSVYLFHIRNTDYGADIYLKGATVEWEQDGKGPVLAQIGEDAESWIEAKTTGDTTRHFELTANEYRRAYLEEEAYLIIRVCKARTEEVTYDRIISNLPRHEAENKVLTQGGLKLSYDF